MLPTLLELQSELKKIGLESNTQLLFDSNTQLLLVHLEKWLEYKASGQKNLKFETEIAQKIFRLFPSNDPKKFNDLINKIIRDAEAPKAPPLTKRMVPVQAALPANLDYLDLSHSSNANLGTKFTRHNLQNNHPQSTEHFSDSNSSNAASRIYQDTTQLYSSENRTEELHDLFAKHLKALNQQQVKEIMHQIQFFVAIEKAVMWGSNAEIDIDNIKNSIAQIINPDQIMDEIDKFINEERSLVDELLTKRAGLTTDNLVVGVNIPQVYKELISENLIKSRPLFNFIKSEFLSPFRLEREVGFSDNYSQVSEEVVIQSESEDDELPFVMDDFPPNTTTQFSSATRTSLLNLGKNPK